METTYDAASRVTAINRTLNGSGTNVSTLLAYDSADRVTTLTHQVSGGSMLDSLVYGYDSGGRLKTETNTEGLATYGYDAANQLTSVSRPAGQTNESYSYDSGGNRTMTGYTTGVGNELLASPGATYAYDAEGNMTAKTETTTGNVWSYTYDIRNRMTGVTEKNSGGSVIYQASYTYDALDRRIATTVNGTTAWMVYDGQNTYADFSGAGMFKTRYLYGPAVDALLARTDASGTTAWYLTDRLGSVRDLASTSGTALDHLTYDAYGNIVSESNPSNGDRFKWTAREWDGTTGLQFNRHRYYAPSVGRFGGTDNLGLESGDYNTWRYVNDSPTQSTDPNGQQESPVDFGGSFTITYEVGSDSLLFGFGPNMSYSARGNYPGFSLAPTWKYDSGRYGFSGFNLSPQTPDPGITLAYPKQPETFPDPYTGVPPVYSPGTPGKRQPIWSRPGHTFGPRPWWRTPFHPRGGFRPRR